jgi:hypothetical protein
MDHVRALVALTHDRNAPDYLQFVSYLTIYTQLRYKLDILKYYHSNVYTPTSLLATAPVTLDRLVERNTEISADSTEYARNAAEIEKIRLEKNAEIESLTRDFIDSIDALVESTYMKRYKYSPAYLDMLRRQLNNHYP